MLQNVCDASAQWLLHVKSVMKAGAFKTSDISPLGSCLYLGRSGILVRNLHCSILPRLPYII